MAQWPFGSGVRLPKGHFRVSRRGLPSIPTWKHLRDGDHEDLAKKYDLHHNQSRLSFRNFSAALRYSAARRGRPRTGCRRHAPTAEGRRNPTSCRTRTLPDIPSAQTSPPYSLGFPSPRRRTEQPAEPAPLAAGRDLAPALVETRAGRGWTKATAALTLAAATDPRPTPTPGQAATAHSATFRMALTPTRPAAPARTHPASKPVAPASAPSSGVRALSAAMTAKGTP